MAVNEAAGLLPADFIVSLHPENMGRYRRLQYETFGNRRVSTHAAAPDRFNHACDYYWHRAHSGATSAWTGVLIGKLMGFEQIVMCGCPMTGGDGYAINTETDTGPRFGMSAAESLMVQNHQAALKKAVEAGEGDGVFSMSGFSRELLGPPMVEKKRANRR